MIKNLTDADNFEFIFPTNDTPEEKFMLIDVTLMIDTDFMRIMEIIY